LRKPLYVRVPATIPTNPSFLDVDRLLAFCPQCKIERPFGDRLSRGSGTGLGEPRTASGSYFYKFYCAGCNFAIEYWLEFSVEESWLRKVGQVPPWSTRIEPELERLLGNDADYYRKGLICLSQGYGLGACAYFRRVVENHVNQILELLIQVAAEDATQSDQVSELKELLESKVADKKLAAASKHVPVSLVVGGVNPVRLIYERLSQGIHGLTDDECANVASELSTALQYVLLETSRHLANRRAFVPPFATWPLKVPPEATRDRSTG